MKKHLLKTICIVLTIFYFNSLCAQGFIWVKGAVTTNSNGAYGTMGSTLNPGTNPGARDGSTFWKDANGTFWMFGGEGYDGNGNLGRLNDLWKFNSSLNIWTWVNGSSIIDQIGMYGTQGIASNTVFPGSRNNAITWTDASGNFYLFGGYGYGSSATQGFLNDLWKYNPTTNLWTWIKGTGSVYQTGSYGTMGVSSSTNMPGARDGAVVWKDLSGNTWLFGGLGVATNSSTTVHLNDLWKFDNTLQQWTWMSGSNLGNQNGSYGSIGVPNASNIPGGRFGATSWTDAAGNLYFMGGSGYDGSSSSNGSLNDLWKYNITTNEWVWLKGSNTKNQFGFYGAVGVSSGSNTPGARYGAMAWKDAYDNCWLASGQGYSAVNAGNLSDVWIYSPSTNNWTWIAGAGNSNLLGVYGALYTPNPQSNAMGARKGSANWLDANNNLWFFGGYGMPQTGTAGYLNDTWKYTNCVINPISMTVTSNIPLPCAGENVTLTVSGANTYTWIAGQSSTLSNLVVTTSVTTTYSAITNNSNNCIYSAGIIQAVNACTGLTEKNTLNQSVVVFPNPSDGKINFNFSNLDNCEIKITDLNGKLIFEQKQNSALEKVDLDFKKGLYFYEITQQQTSLSRGKLVIE